MKVKECKQCKKLKGFGVFASKYVPNRPFFEPKRRLSELSDQRHLLWTMLYLAWQFMLQPVHTPIDMQAHSMLQDLR